jgi:hypothetical protein
LVITSNTLKHYTKNIFLRNFIVPSYLNGFNKYLNSEALLFDGEKYKVLYTLDDDWEEV